MPRFKVIGIFRPRLYILWLRIELLNSLSDLHLKAKSSPLDGSITASGIVSNTGARAADEVVQLYLHQRYGSSNRCSHVNFKVVRQTVVDLKIRWDIEAGERHIG
jgi:hypothetical protein